MQEQTKRQFSALLSLSLSLFLHDEMRGFYILMCATGLSNHRSEPISMFSRLYCNFTICIFPLSPVHNSGQIRLVAACDAIIS